MLLRVIYMLDGALPGRDDANLIPESLAMNRAVVLILMTVLAGCAKPAPSPLAAQSDCPATLPDVDRLACWVSARPETAPDTRKPSVLLRNSDGRAVIGPNAPEPARNPDGSLVIGPRSPQ